MLTALLDKIKPIRGFSHPIHLALVAALPIIAYILVRIDFVGLAILLVLIAKWRIVAVKPRYWMANFIANGIDTIAGISFVIFMSTTSVKWWQLFWMLAYIAWLTWLKPRSGVLYVAAQAMFGQLLGLAVLYLKFGDASTLLLMAGTWVITYLAARHYLTSFDEPHAPLLAHVWAYFSAGLAFVLGHWLLFYGLVAQIIIILTTIGYGIAALYYMDATERLTSSFEKQALALMVAILVIVIVLSDWSGTTI
ncbi:hypothetical protein A3F65_00435 [Candidatus Saccharibacteria bacterium RIFCSPHIGHO2_12_FULL_47_16b]|nr:MAG: hypothetical protein A3F65_00435 [Candidatus Saccharibacteria bacterium RIFCSPHIGHO2_12_FULL_47_16b]